MIWLLHHLIQLKMQPVVKKRSELCEYIKRSNSINSSNGYDGEWWYHCHYWSLNMTQCLVQILYFSISGTVWHGRSRFWYCHYCGLFVLTLTSKSTEWSISNFIHVVFPLSNASLIYVCMCIIDTFYAYAKEMGSTSSSIPCLMCTEVLELL
jgi:hypothetical protein